MPINDPRDISGLVLWYSAQAETGYANGQSMTGWTDLSGNGNHATAVGTLAPQWESSTGSGGGAAVKFRGTHGSTSATWGYFSLPASVMGSAAAGEILTQIKSDGVSCSLWGLGLTAGTSAASHYPFSSAVYEGFGTTARKTAFSTTSVAVNVWRRYNVWSAASDYACRVDATSEYTSGSNTVLWDATPVIGHGKRNGGLSDNSGSFKGHMSVVILYSRKLTTTERADLDAWLVANPHGGTAAPPAGTVSLAGTRQAKTAAFAVATVLAASLVGTMPAKTASFDLSASAQVSLAGTMRAKTAAFTVDLPTAPDRTATLAGTRQPRTGSFALLAGESIALAGQVQSKAATFSLASAAQVSLAGTVQAKTGAFEVSTADRSVALAGAKRRRTSSIILAASPVLRLAGTRRAKTGAFFATTRPTVSLAGTVQGKIAQFTTYVVTPVTPAPDSVTAAQSYVSASAFGAVSMVGTQPVYTASEAATRRARQQIVVDGVDFSYFRDVVTPDVTYTLLEPLLYGPGNLTLPQVSACFERPGHCDLAPLRPGAVVEVHRVIDDVVVGTDYKGVIVAFDLSGRDLSVELGGEASGRAALRNRQAVIFPRVNDLGHQISDAVRDLGLPHLPALGATTGIEAMTTGGVGHLEHIQNLVAKAWTVNGGHWTVMPDEATGIYRTSQKDETTIHATAFLDDARTVGNLRRDISEEPNRVYPTTVTPQGQRVRFGVYPDLNQGPVPDYPGLLKNGDTGEGVRLLIGKLHAVGYLRLYEVSGGFDVDVVEAVKDLQDDAGLPKTGEVDIVTWQALYDLNITDTSLVSAHIEPAAQRGVVRQKNRSASGTVLGFNDNYDPDILKVDLNVDLGSGFNRSQARRFARAKLHDSNDSNWVGDVTFNTGALLRGTVGVGATVTEADVMDARELRPGMNVRLHVLGTIIVVHVAACEVGDTVKASVDTRSRDALEVWEVIARNKESRNDPARRRNRAQRSSTIAKDSIGEWDEIGGQLGHDVTLDAGWNVFEVVAAMEGTIARFRVELGTPAEFACAVFGDKVDRGFMEDVIGPPLTTAGEKNWRRATPRARLRDHWLLYSAGTPDEPCGYGEDLKSDAAPLTGVHRDDAGFAYRSADRTKLYVAVWVPAANTIPLGRIMWPQLEAGA